MELVVFFLALLVTGVVVYSVQCFIFFGLTERPVLLAFTLSAKLAVGSLVGAVLFGFGAILLPTIWINAAIEQLPNYSKVRDIAVSFLISTLSSVIMYGALFALAWEILD